MPQTTSYPPFCIRRPDFLDIVFHREQKKGQIGKRRAEIADAATAPRRYLCRSAPAPCLRSILGRAGTLFLFLCERKTRANLSYRYALTDYSRQVRHFLLALEDRKVPGINLQKQLACLARKKLALKRCVNASALGCNARERGMASAMMKQVWQWHLDGYASLDLLPMLDRFEQMGQDALDKEKERFHVQLVDLIVRRIEKSTDNRDAFFSETKSNQIVDKASRNSGNPVSAENNLLEVLDRLLPTPGVKKDFLRERKDLRDRLKCLESKRPKKAKSLSPIGNDERAAPAKLAVTTFKTQLATLANCGKNGDTEVSVILFSVVTTAGLTISPRDARPARKKGPKTMGLAYRNLERELKVQRADIVKLCENATTQYWLRIARLAALEHDAQLKKPFWRALHALAIAGRKEETPEDAGSIRHALLAGYPAETVRENIRSVMFLFTDKVQQL